jgi:hypothetical protein
LVVKGTDGWRVAIISLKERNSSSICSIVVENGVWRGYLGAGFLNIYSLIFAFRYNHQMKMKDLGMD